jgi:hypothetical protein
MQKTITSWPVTGGARSNPGANRRHQVNHRKRWFVRIGAYAVIVGLFWNTAIVSPLRIFAVFFHEIFHALAAFLTGGGVTAIEVTSYEAGRTALYGGLPLIVYSAGYLGTALFGGVFLLSGRNIPAKRTLYLSLAVLTLCGTFLFMRNAFGWAYGLVTGALLLILFFKEFRFADLLTDLLGVVCVLYAFYDFGDLLRTDNRNDALILHEKSGIPYQAIVVIWLVLSVVFVAAALFLTARAIPPAGGERSLRQRDFRLRIRSDEMFRSSGNPIRKRGRLTLAVYVSVIAVLVGAVIWASRFVLFQPWTAREWVASVEVENSIYAIGGRDRHGQVYSEIFKIQPERKKIRTVAELPSPRYGIGAAAVDGLIYIYGGFDGRWCYDDVVIFDVTTGELDTVAHLPGGRAFGGTAKAGDAVYYVGGWDGANVLDEILEYSIQGGTFRRIGSLPSPREFITLVSLDGKLYVIGGSDDRGQYLDEVLEIDAKSGDLLRTAYLPYEIKRGAAAVRDSDIVLMGGWEGKRSARATAIRPGAEEFTITALDDLPRGFSDTALIAYNDKLVLIGGNHPRFKRQIGFLMIDLDTGMSEDIKFRSFLFW